MKYGFWWGLAVGLTLFGMAQATVYNIDIITNKSTGSAISAVEFNTLIGTLVGFDRDDQGTSLLDDDKYGLGLADAVAPSEKLDVNGNVKADAFIGDGSLLTNITATSLWSQNASDINYAGGSVGIGNAYPDEVLHVNGTVKADDFMFQDGSLVSAMSGGGGGGSSEWSTNGSNIYRNTGYVGIGLTNPNQALDVQGTVRGRGVVTASDPWDGSGVQLGGNVLGWTDQGGTNDADSVNGAPDLWLTASNQVYVRSPGGLNVNQKVSSPSYCDENGLNCFGTPRIDIYRINTQTSGYTNNADSACQASGYQGYWAGMNQNGNENILCYVISGIPIYLNY